MSEVNFTLILFHVTTPHLPPPNNDRQGTVSLMKHTFEEYVRDVRRRLAGVLQLCPKAPSEDKAVIISPSASPSSQRWGSSNEEHIASPGMQTGFGINANA